MRASSFDRDEARKAWREVARVRGAGRLVGSGGPRSGGGLSAKRIVVGVVVAVLAVLGVAELTSSEDPSPPPNAPRTAAHRSGATAGAPVARRSRPTSSPVRTPAGAPAQAAVPNTARSRVARRASASADTIAPERTRAAVERPSARTIPVGTATSTAKAYVKVPLGRSDLAPIGAIARTGLHVDRIAVGTSYANNRCAGPSDAFAVGRDGTISVCIRAVHRRRGERLLVRWEKDGVLMRRTRLHIPRKHAYRTRARLRLRPGYAGEWTAKITSRDGARELAAVSFTVE